MFNCIVAKRADFENLAMLFSFLLELLSGKIVKLFLAFHYI